MVHFDRWWNPASERQAEDRSHRMGQTSPVDVYTYTCSDTIEERIADLLEAKQRLFDTIVDQVTMDLDRVLSAEELFGLFGLKPPQKQPARTSAVQPPKYNEMTGREFEVFVERLFRDLGYQTELTQRVARRRSRRRRPSRGRRRCNYNAVHPVQEPRDPNRRRGGPGDCRRCSGRGCGRAGGGDMSDRLLDGSDAVRGAPRRSAYR